MICMDFYDTFMLTVLFYSYLFKSLGSIQLFNENNTLHLFKL